MRLLALVPAIYDTSPGQRFRMEQWEPLLRRRGVEITFEPFESEELHSVLYQPGNLRRKLSLVLRAALRRITALRSLSDYDAVYVFREAALLGPPLVERWIQSRGVPIVFDFDDAVWVPTVSPTNGYLSLLKFPAKTRTACKISAHVMAGNDYLARYAQRVNRNVTVIPTTIDTDKYTIEAKHKADDVPVIGWSGSHSTAKYLDALRPALSRLAERRKFRLRVIGAPEFKMDGVEVEALPWRSESEVADLRPMDIGVMPLPNDRWTRGKCGLKALQYMALGIPTLCSPVGVNTAIIRDGDNGMLAATPDEWVEKLEQLLRSAPLRTQLGAAGRATVEAGYSAVSQAPRVQDILEAAVGKRGS